MSVNAGLTPNPPRAVGLLCTACGACSVALSGVGECIPCEAATARRVAAADEMRTWKRYTAGNFR
jgi:hypothetical protein